MDTLKKRIAKFKSLAELKELADRLFQKDPQIKLKLNSLLSENWNNGEATHDLRHFIMTTIAKVVESQRPGLPLRLENYISFCDLTYMVQHSQEKVWHTLHLQDYKNTIHDEGSDPFVPVIKLRRTLKKSIEENFPNLAASVQYDYRLTEEESLQSAKSELIFFRVTTVPNYKGKNKEKVEAKLCKKRPSYFIYFPGEPYLYTDSKNPDQNHLQGLVETLKCSGHENLSLSGRNVEALRKMRIIREQQKNLGVDVALNVTSPPRLEMFSMQYIADAEQIHVNFQGSDVLRGLTAFKETNIFPNGSPEWAAQALTRGRNVIKVKKRDTQTDEEIISDAESDVTAL